MNDALLSQRLRELRVAPPASGFDERLRDALSKAARDMAPLTPSRPIGSSASRQRRFRPRLGVTLIVAFGASAAAAAAGWVGIASRSDVDEVTVPAASAVAAASVPRAKHLERSPPSVELTPDLPPTPEAPTPLASVRTGSARTASSSRSPPEVTRAPAAKPSPRVPLEQPLDPDLPALTPFELPDVNAAQHRDRAAPDMSVMAGRGSRAQAARDEPARRGRPLPKLEPARPERAERGQSELARERAATRERLGRENAERGLERARAARDKNGR